MERNKLARQIIDTCLEMTRLGLNQGTAGNVSVRYQDGMLITPTGIPYEKLTESHIVFIDGNGKHEEGKLPSSEWRFHMAAYQSRPEPSPFEQMSQEELNAQAKTLLSAAGYGPQKPLKLTLLYNTSENHQKIAIAVASMWKKNLGVDVKLQNQEWKTYIDSRNTGNFDVIRASWVGDYNEPSTFLTLLTSTHSGCKSVMVFR